MVQPINYSLNVQSPMQAFGQAAQFGAGLAEMDARRQAAQQEAIRAQSLNQEFQRVSAIQNPQAKDFMALSFLLPKDQMESIRATYEMGSKEQKENQLSFSGKVLSAFTSGNNQIGIDLLLNRAEAEENSGRKDQAQAFRTYAELAKINPGAAKTTIGMMLASVPGGDKVIEATTKAQLAPLQVSKAQVELRNAMTAGQPKPGFTLLTPAENIKLGLPEGIRFQRGPDGKIEELKVSGAGFRVLTREEKAQRGLPIDANLQIGPDGKVLEVVRGPLVTVDTGSTFGPVPAGFQRVRDPETGDVREIEIPGGVAERKRLDDEKKALGRQTQTARAGGTVVQDLQRALNLVRTNPNVTGRTAAVTLALPEVARAETDVQAAEAFIQSALSNVGLDTLQQMRENSPTGGALGQVPIQQQQRLEQVLGSLDLTQRKEIVEDNLKRVINIYSDIINGTPEQIMERFNRGEISKNQADDLSFRLELSFDERGNPLPKKPRTGRDRRVPQYTPPAPPPATPAAPAAPTSPSTVRRLRWNPQTQQMEAR
jgi:hypothetical protein